MKSTKRIIVKNSDKLASMVHDSKVVDEYLVYLLEGEIPIFADVVYGSDEKNQLVDRLLEDNFDITENIFNDGIIEELTFTEYLEQFK